MKQEERKVLRDAALGIEAYQFRGIMQKFPNHFHEYYVIGFIEKGRRHLSCRNQDYDLEAGDLILLNPFDNHACEQIDEGTLDWRCINISKETMKRTVQEITGTQYLPVFRSNVARGSRHAAELRSLHQMVLGEQEDLEKEEQFLLLLEALLRTYTDFRHFKLPEVSEGIQRACDFMDKNYPEPVTLDALCAVSGFKKYTLLRTFTRERGVTPYQYLETIRVNEARRLLERGVEPLETAMQTGFSDQSHFTRFFKNFTGLTPGYYQTICQRDEAEE